MGLNFQQYQPHFKRNIGVGMIKYGYWDNNKKILVNIADQEFREGLIKDLPLIQWGKNGSGY